MSGHRLHRSRPLGSLTGASAYPISRRTRCLGSDRTVGPSSSLYESLGIHPSVGIDVPAVAFNPTGVNPHALLCFILRLLVLEARGGNRLHTSHRGHYGSHDA
jgi:hypothetical protein